MSFHTVSICASQPSIGGSHTGGRVGNGVDSEDEKVPLPTLSAAFVR